MVCERDLGLVDFDFGVFPPTGRPLLKQPNTSAKWHPKSKSTQSRSKNLTHLQEVCPHADELVEEGVSGDVEGVPQPVALHGGILVTKMGQCQLVTFHHNRQQAHS